MKFLGAVLELPAKQHCQSSPFISNWQYCLAGSSKTAPRILIFSIGMGAEYSSYVKFIAIYALTFFGYIILVFTSVYSEFSITRTVHCYSFELTILKHN